MSNVTSWFTIPCWQFCVLFGSEDINNNACMHINGRERVIFTECFFFDYVQVREQRLLLFSINRQISNSVLENDPEFQTD